MAHIIDKIDLQSPTPGVRRFIKVHKFISETAGPKVYLQAALHADEWPGLLTLQHLLAELIELDEQQRLCGEIIVVPFANPIGMDQRINGTVIGRHSFSAEGNFNRNWPDFSNITQALVEDNPDVSVAVIRKSLRQAVADMPRNTPLNELKAILLSYSIDADVVLDLHCDSQALVHIYSNYRHQSEANKLAQFMDCPIVLLEDEPGGSPFDAAQVKHWIAVADKGIPLSCFSVTIELRGFADVNDQFAQQDAQNLLRFMANQGSINMSLPAPKTVDVFTTDLQAVDSIHAPQAGIICWKRTIGDRIEAGELIAEIVDLEADTPSQGRTSIYSNTTGILFTTTIARLVTVGEHVAKIAGSEPLKTASGSGLLTL